MKNKTVEVGDFAQAVSEVIDNYYGNIADKANLLVAETAVQTVQRLEQNAPRDKGDYARSFYIRQNKKRKDGCELEIANKRYQLTHLLEHGHVQKVHNTIIGFANAQPHWIQAEREAIDKILNGLVRIVK